MTDSHGTSDVESQHSKSDGGSSLQDDIVDNRIVKLLYGDISRREFGKFFLLGATFFFIIGGYWLLRPLKDGVFFSIVGGKEYQPYAKMLSVIVVVVVVLIYSKLVDRFNKVHLFYIVTGFFASALFLIGLLMLHPTIGISNTVSSPYRLLGWFTYFTVECYGSLMVSMFWSFVSSITDAQSARRGYSIIIGAAQIGAIIGPFLAINAAYLGVPMLFVIAGISTFGIVILVRHFVTTLPEQAYNTASHSMYVLSFCLLMYCVAVVQSKDKDEKKNTGFFEGLKLIVSRPYILGILCVSTLYEIISTITDYQMKVLAHDTPAYSSAEGLTTFLGIFGMVTNSLALVMALTSTSFVMRRYGLRFCLLAYPVSVALTSFILYYCSSFPIEQMLWITFGVMVATKGLSYALNNPAKEIMYIPTSNDVKYKAKSWIDLFGGRLSKAGGSVATNMLKQIPDPGSLMRSGVLISLAIVAVWSFAAHKVGQTFQRLTARNEIID